MGLAKYFYTSGIKLDIREEIFFGVQPKSDKIKLRVKKDKVVALPPTNDKNINTILEGLI